jgi:hypothetical protein
MNILKKTAASIDRKVVLSTLWIFVLLNYIYADIYTVFFNQEALKNSLTISQGFALITAILMETAIVMVLLSRVLKFNINRWTNIIIGVFHTAFVAWSMIGTTVPAFYVFFAAIEMACTLFIAWYAWRWRKQEVQ